MDDDDDEEENQHREMQGLSPANAEAFTLRVSQVKKDSAD